MKTERHIVNNLYSQLEQLIRRSRQSIVQAVNLTMVSTYFEIGEMIVEYEQDGKERAEYGSSLLKKLSEKLSKDFPYKILKTCVSSIWCIQNPRQCLGKLIPLRSH